MSIIVILIKPIVIHLPLIPQIYNFQSQKTKSLLRYWNRLFDPLGLWCAIF